mmetsp:Transcript_11075/g.25359  ORF Transcript_11075/g.25359 Transcript_11075/m.25359 type:complete len:487 (+) Transcript_11075:73-1533(+)
MGAMGADPMAQAASGGGVDRGVQPVPPSVPSCPSGGNLSGFRHRRTGREVYRCKKAHRSEIGPHEWSKFGYCFKEEVLQQPICYDGKQTLPIPRIKRSEITPEEFFERFALPRRPCIIEGAIEDWPAMQRWDIGPLLEHYAHAPFKVGEDDKGRKLRMKLKYFVDYMQSQQDDSPLYLFETKMEGDPVFRHLLEDFTVPDLFPHDFFDLMNSHSKPPYRWWSIGPKRSGTTVHKDPLGTAAWNAVTHGRKRWVIFEPEPIVPARVAKGKDVIDKQKEDDEAVMYFDFLLPRIKAKHPQLRVYEGIQNAGEVIFVPGNWWHGVINLEDTVAVTQNYCGYDNFDDVWQRTRRERKKLAYLWLRNMRKFAPDLYRRAMQLNQIDAFVMRHERKADEVYSSSDSDSSSSESSSDSSSDAECDLDLWGEQAKVQIAPPWLRGAATPGNGETVASVATPQSAAHPSCPVRQRKRPHGWSTPEPAEQPPLLYA